MTLSFILHFNLVVNMTLFTSLQTIKAVTISFVYPVLQVTGLGVVGGGGVALHLKCFNTFKSTSRYTVIARMNARDTLLEFLQSLNPDVLYMESTVEELVESNFDTLDDNNMRLLIDTALRERDENIKNGKKEEELLGSWGVIIDLIKNTTIQR